MPGSVWPMMDSNHLADVLLEEARLFATSMKFNDAPELTSGEKFKRGVAQFPLPDRSVIATVIEEVFWASLLTEEGRPCRPMLVYSPREHAVSRAVHRLVTPVPLNRDSLRKLTPVQGSLGYLTWDRGSERPEITGIEGRQGGDSCNFVISSPDNGALDISWSCFRLVAVRAGRLYRQSQVLLPDVHAVGDIVRQLLQTFAPVFLGRAIGAIVQDGHGGALWVLREGQNLDGIEIGHPIRRDERPLPQQHEQRTKWLESVGHLAAVDGAVVLDAQLRVLGFGAFIDVSDQPKPITCFSGAGQQGEIRLSKDLGGGRHRSAVEFCGRFAPAAAIVVSEDGRISLIWASAHDQLFWIPMSILGFSDTILASTS